MNSAQALLKKFESAFSKTLVAKQESGTDSVTVRLKFDEIESVQDLTASKELAKELFKQSQSFDRRADIDDVTVDVNGNTKTVLITVIFKGSVDKKAFIEKVRNAMVKTPLLSKTESDDSNDESIELSATAEKFFENLFEVLDASEIDEKLPVSIFDSTFLYISSDDDGEFTVYDTNKEEIEEFETADELISYFMELIPQLPELVDNEKLSEGISEEEFFSNATV